MLNFEKRSSTKNPTHNIKRNITLNVQIIHITLFDSATSRHDLYSSNLLERIQIIERVKRNLKEEHQI